MSPAPDPLDAALQALSAAPPRQPGSVQREVWRRLEQAENARALRTHRGWQRIEAAFAHPAFATVFVAACLLLGLFLAEVRLNRAHHERTSALERSYLQLIDPLLSATHLPRAETAAQRP